MTTPTKAEPKRVIDTENAALAVAAICIDAGCFLIAVPLGLIVLGVLIVVGVVISATGLLPVPKDES